MPGRYRRNAITRYTLVEHETLPGFVVAVAITAKQADDVREHTGVVFADYAKANDSADDINEWACVAEGDGPEPLYPNRAAHLTGFSSKFRIDGRRLYKPLTTPEHAI